MAVRSGRSQTLSIVIAGDAKGVQRATGEASASVDQLSNRIKSSAVDVARAWATFQGIQFLRGSAEAAASLAASQETVDAVFKGAAGSVRAFGEESVDALGLSEQAALSAASNFGTLFQGMDIGADKAAAMSKRMLELAADMAAARDVPVDQAVQALFSGLSGEAEPLKRFGVLINESTVKAKALELGLASGTDALDAQTKAMATYELILERTALMQGSWARESDGLLAQQQKMSAEWENAKAKLGAELVPALSAAAGATTDLLDLWGKLPGTVQLGAVALAGLAVWGPEIATGLRAAKGQLELFRLGMLGVGTAGDGVANALGTVTTSAGRTGAETSAMNRALAVTPSQFGAINTAALAAAAGIGAFSATTAGLNKLVDLQTTKADAERLGVALEDLGQHGSVSGELEKYGSSLDDLADSIGKAYASKPDQLLDSLGDSGTDIRAAANEVNQLDDALAALAKTDPDAAAKAYGQISAKLIGQGVSAEKVARAFDNYLDAVDDAALAADDDTAATEENTAARETNAEAIKRQDDALREQVDSARQRIDLERAVSDSVDDLTSAQDDLADARRAAAPGSREHQALLDAESDAADAVTDSRRDQVDALRGVVDAERGVTDAQRGVLDAQRDLNDARAEAKRRIDDMAAAARSAALDERGAQLAVERAKFDLDVILRSNASDLDKREAQLRYDEAVEAARTAGEETRRAREDAATAQRQGVEGAPEVVAAKEQIRQAEERLTEAHRGVVEAQDRVVAANDRVRDTQERLAESKRNTAEQMREASKRVADAERKVEDATLDVADAFYAQERANGSARSAAEVYRDVLRLLALDTAPDSTLRRNLRGLADDLQRALTPPTGSFSGWWGPGADPFGQRGGGFDWSNPFGLPRGSRPTGGTEENYDWGFGPDPNRPGGAPPAPRVNQTVNVTVNGSDVQTRRETERVLTKALNDAAKAMTGG